jgi:uncharacterized membrane protein
MDIISIVGLVFAPWVLFALMAAFGDATVGFVDEWLLHKLDDQDGTAHAPGKLLLISGFFGFIVALIAYGLSIINPTLVPMYDVHAFDLAMLAGVIEVLWLIPYFYALNLGGAINTTPLFQTIPIFALLFGVTIFNEIPTLLSVVATVCIIAGAVVLNYSNELHKINYKSIILMFVASALIALALFTFKEAESSSNFITAVIGNGLGMGIASLIIWLIHPIYREQFNSFVKKFDTKIIIGQFANEGLYSFSALASQAAIVLGPSVMVVSAFNAFHPIFTVIIGWTLSKMGIKIRTDALQTAEIKTTLAGVVLITAGAILLIF